MRLGRKLNMKTKREHRNTHAKVAQGGQLECRFAEPIRFAVVIRVHTKNKQQHIQHEP